MYRLISEDYLMHHGVKGMKWGVRHDPERIGRISSYSRGSPSRRYSSSGASQSKKRKAKKAAKIGAIAAGAVLTAAAGTYLVKSGKVSSIAKIGKAAISSKSASKIKDVGKKSAQKTLNLAWKSKNAAAASRNLVRASTKFIRAPMKRATRMATAPIRKVTAPIRRVTNPVAMPLKRAIYKVPAGRTFLKVYGAAVLASDMNSVYQWANKSKSKGRITKEDTKELVKDMLNPIPNNIPKIRKVKNE